MNETATGDYQVNTDLTGYWQDFQSTYPYPTYYYNWPSTVVEDKGKKAFEVVKALSEKGLVDVKTGKRFIELMETILAVM